MTSMETMNSELAAKQADVDEARLSLEWTRVTAPISGRIGAALLKAGNIAQPNVDTLAVINQIQPIYVSFSLPENSLAQVRERIKEGTTSVQVFEPDSGKALGTGELHFINNTVDRTSGMITFKAVFPNPEEALWPGEYVDVTVRLGEETGVVIPSVAVMEGQNAARVFVVDGDTASLRKVKVKRSENGLAMIADGLQPGEKVVTVGQLNVAPGSKVSVHPAPAPSRP